MTQRGTIGASAEGRLLDLACGIGQISFALHSRFGEVWGHRPGSANGPSSGGWPRPLESVTSAEGRTIPPARTGPRRPRPSTKSPSRR